MTLKITHQKDEKKILISFDNNILEVSDTSNNWNNEGINQFLIKIAAKIKFDTSLEIDYEKENQDPIYNFVVDLFKKFQEIWFIKSQANYDQL